MEKPICGKWRAQLFKLPIHIDQTLVDGKKSPLLLPRVDLPLRPLLSIIRFPYK